MRQALDQARVGLTVQKFNMDGTPMTPESGRGTAAEPDGHAHDGPAAHAGHHAGRAEVAMAKLPVSPLAVPLPALPPLGGVQLGAAEAGIRYKGRTDLVMVTLAPGTTVAGVFTSNKCPGAPVDWCRAALAGGSARGRGGECRQRQRVHRRTRAGDDTGHGGGGGALLGCAARTRCSWPAPA